jgi:phenylalanyl-tRNA synthetase beta chain
MRLSFDWLCDFVDLSGIKPEEVAERLTAGAFEVEEVRRVGPDVEGPLVVGEIVEINPHPNADKIRLTKVKIDNQGEPQEIVCGASNIIVGQRIPVALPGARVLNRHDGTALPIKVSKIRGVQSNGMLCSAGELGITAPDDGILVLYGTPELGSDVKKLLNLYPDWILHVEPRSNRGDALSVLGMAREVAAVCNRPLVVPGWQLPQDDQTHESVQIHLENQSECPYFSMRIIQGVHVKPSSLHMIRRLESIGVRAVNNVVDVTNYVLHELGQPLHAYDLAKLRGPVMEVRRARGGEKLVTIDGKDRELTEEVLVVADSQKVVAVAGVMGGKESEVTEETTFIALEAAAFQAARVRRSGRLLGLSSDSSLRFERGVDVASVRQASDRATYLLLQNCGGSLGKITSGGHDKVTPVTIDLRLSRLKKLLDLDLSADTVEDLLSPLELKVTSKQADKVTVNVPSFRQGDVTREIDLVEEVCRRWGYDRIESVMPKATAAPELPEDIRRLAGQTMSACGLSEAWISSLVGESDMPAGCDSLVKVNNPLSDDHQMLRQTLIPGLVRAVAYNQDRGRKDVWLYEIGRSYKKSSASNSKEPGVTEELLLAGVMCGAAAGYWQQAGQATDYYAAKGVVEALLNQLSIDMKSVSFDAQAQLPAWCHPGRSCALIVKHKNAHLTLGYLGELHPASADGAGLRQRACVFELSLDVLKQVRQPKQFREIYSTPFVVRDLTVDVMPEVHYQQVHGLITAKAGKNLAAVELVSIFQLADGQNSLSYRLSFQHPEQTLTAEQVETELNAVRDALKSELAASFRL